MTGEILPNFATQGLTEDQLSSDEELSKTAREIAEFSLTFIPYEMDDEGMIFIDFSDQLTEISMMSENTYDIFEWVTQDQGQAWLDAA